MRSPPCQPFSRRELLLHSANGFGALALASLADKSATRIARADRTLSHTASEGTSRQGNTTIPAHHAPRARNVIFLYMDGGPSQVDTFDPKSRLIRDHGKPIPLDVPITAERDVGTILKSPWKFRRYGESGIPVSALFPHVGSCADELCVIRSMVSRFSEHSAANLFLHSGIGRLGRPSLGAWVNYGLGSECKNLPGFVVLSSGMIPPAGEGCFDNGRLPARFQASVFKSGARPLADLRDAADDRPRHRKWDMLKQINRHALQRTGHIDELEAAISKYELAFQMQTAVPELVELTGESRSTQQLYGLEAGDVATQTYGRQCLVARRLIERGVRFVEILCPDVGSDRWDQHEQLVEGHERNARAVDQPIAGLLTDLKARGLLEETLVIWAGEFGRTPMAQGTDGRDHNPFGFSIWLAGAGIRPGMIYGATDEFGYYAIENAVEIHDLHATILHLLGIDHTQLTIPVSGRDLRLTDVYGNVVDAILTT